MPKPLNGAGNLRPESTIIDISWVVYAMFHRTNPSSRLDENQPRMHAYFGMTLQRYYSQSLWT